MEKVLLLFIISQVSKLVENSQVLESNNIHTQYSHKSAVPIIFLQFEACKQDKKIHVPQKYLLTFVMIAADAITTTEWIATVQQ